MTNRIYSIKGMHCRSCELLIEEEVSKIHLVSSVKANFKKSEVQISSEKPLDEKEVIKAIDRAGYKLGEKTEKPWLNQNGRLYVDLMVSVIILWFLYVIFKISHIRLDFNPSNNSSSLAVVLLIGLTAGVSTCMALVGGLVLGASARFAEKHPNATSIQKFRPHLFFNIGRIASYAALGGVLGLIGSTFQLSSRGLGVVTLVIALVMLTLGLQLTEIFPKLANFSFALPSSVGKIFGLKKHGEKEYSHFNSILLGAITFFLPCGFTQAMQVLALSSGHFTNGALIMGTFALGTAPGLLSIGGITSIIKGNFAKLFFRFTGVVVVALAIFNLTNGLNLVGFKGFTSKAATPTDVSNVTVENGVQIVKMDQLANGYTPNTFTVKVNMPVKWIVTSKSQTSCASSLNAPDLNIGAYLKAGENIFEFTPKETGQISFSCSMGMYKGQFYVIKNNDPNVSPLPNVSPSPSQKVEGEQLIKATYASKTDISPKEFKVNVNQPVRLEILANDNGVGCMGSVALPGLVDGFQRLVKDKTLVFSFTPKQKGIYKITCSMGSVRGQITVQ